jgi:ribonuclease HI
MHILGMEKEKRLLVIALLWQWWTARNKKNACDGNRYVEEVVFQTRRWAREFVEFYAAKSAKSRPSSKEEKWRPPGEEQILKVNVDGAFKDNPRSGCWGFVIRDKEGQVTGSGAGHMMFPQSALHAEAETCLQGITTAMNWGMTRVIIESDCQVLVIALNKEGYDRSPIGVLVRDAKLLARLNFTSFSFEYAHRNCNKVAHAMAALGASMAHDNEMPQYVPR